MASRAEQRLLGPEWWLFKQRDYKDLEKMENENKVMIILALVLTNSNKPFLSSQTME